MLSFIIVILVFTGAIIFVIVRGKTLKEGPVEKPIGEKDVVENAMKLESSSFKNNEYIPSKYTCDGDNVNPPLLINEAPGRAQSFALIVDDPDAPAGDWTHWLLWNIGGGATEVLENSVPRGAIQGLNDFGKNGYGGPCPPSGTHRYQLKLHALDTVLNIPQNSRKKDLEKAMEGHILAQSILTGLYQR